MNVTVKTNFNIGHFAALLQGKVSHPRTMIFKAHR